jgi:hypothetical protein
MKWTAAALVMIATIWCYPLAAEGTSDPCRALASQALRIEAMPDQGPNESDDVTLIQSLGDFAVSEAVQRRYSWAPHGIVCVSYYWRLVADPAFLGTLESQGKSEDPPPR